MAIVTFLTLEFQVAGDAPLQRRQDAGEDGEETGEDAGLREGIATGLLGGLSSKKGRKTNVGSPPTTKGDNGPPTAKGDNGPPSTAPTSGRYSPKLDAAGNILGYIDSASGIMLNVVRYELSTVIILLLTSLTNRQSTSS